MIRLEANGVSLQRGGRAIVEDVSFTAHSGMFVGLIGANGAGKSSLMAMLAGLISPDAGQVAVDGQSMTSLSRRSRAMLRAYLPQNPRAEWPISVERLVALGLTPQLPVFGGLPDALQGRVSQALEQFGMVDRAQQAVTTLSGGELARTMLARALVGDPPMLLADEPLAGLDPHHAIDGIGRLRAFADQGRLVIAALHELTMVARYATHVAVLDHGRLIAFGPTQDVLTAPLLRRAFQVDACVTDPGSATAMVDFVALATDTKS